MANKKYLAAGLPNTRTTKVRDRANDGDYRAALNAAIARAQEDRAYRVQVQAKDN